MDNNPIFSPEEQKIRTRWLFWQIELPATLVGLMYLFVFSMNPFHIIMSLFNLHTLVLLTGAISVIVLGFYIPYYFAYKKHGTVFLSLFLIFTSIKLIYDVYGFSSFINKEPSQYAIFFYLIIFSVSALYIAWVFYLSLKLLGINRRAKLKLIESTD